MLHIARRGSRAVPVTTCGIAVPEDVTVKGADDGDPRRDAVDRLRYDRSMHGARTRCLLAMLLPWLLGTGSGTLLSREAAPVPERLRGPLPARIDPAALTTTEALRSVGLGRLPEHQHVRQRLCLGDAGERARFRDGLERALAEPGEPLRWAYFELAAGCEDGRDHCQWLASEADGAPAAAAELLWSALAICWPLDDPGRFEGVAVPDDAVVAFHAKRRRTDRVHSERLAAVVERRVAAAVASAARDALEAYSRMDHPATARRLLRLHAAATDAELRRSLAFAMRNQSDPGASRLFYDACFRSLEAQLAAWREAGGDLRGSPTRWGSPCQGATAADWDAADARPVDDPPPDPLDAIPSALGRRARVLDEADFQFGDHTGLLRQLAALVRPELDDAVFEDVWPAADAVRLYRGPHRVQVFVGGDGVAVGVPERDGAPDLAAAEAIRDELTAALHAPRLFVVWWRGERLHFAHHGTGDDYDVEAALAVTNFLLEEAGSARRVARLAGQPGLALLVAEPAGMAGARERGLLAPAN
jgi:hypothetical protein